MNPDCTCYDAPGIAPLPCEACQRAYSEAVDELYRTDPAFRAELDRWAPADSPEGQQIISDITG